MKTTDFVYINIFSLAVCFTSSTRILLLLKRKQNSQLVLCKLPFLLTNTLPQNDFKKLIMLVASSASFSFLRFTLSAYFGGCVFSMNNKTTKIYLWVTKRELSEICCSSLKGRKIFRRLFFGEISSMLTLILRISGLGSESERSHRWPKSRKLLKPEIDFISTIKKTRSSTFLPFEKRFSISDGISHLSLHSHTHAHMRENFMTSAKIMSYHFHQKQYRRRVSPCAVSVRFKKTPTLWCSSMEKRKKKSEWGKIFNRASSWGEIPRKPQHKGIKLQLAIERHKVWFNTYSPLRMNIDKFSFLWDWNS